MAEYRGRNKDNKRIETQDKKPKQGGTGDLCNGDFVWSVRRGAEVLFYTSHVRTYSTTVDGARAVNNGSNIPFDQSASLSAGAAWRRAMTPLHADRWLTQSCC
jgi:hypothetical protein